MATQKVRPDQGRDEHQQVRRRQVSRTITVATLAIAAITGAMVRRSSHRMDGDSWPLSPS